MYAFTKRALDIGISALLLVALAPVFIVVGLLIATTMGRPVLFRQRRVGRNDEVFTLTKFRSMRTGGSSDAERLTRLGSFLRASSLDELPELVQVLSGKMSLVGPRPLLPEYLPRYSTRQRRRHDVRPGITGLAQVSGRNAIAWDERLELDVVYVETMSVRSDMAILTSTVRSVLRREGVNAEGHATMPEFVGSLEA